MFFLKSPPHNAQLDR